MNDTSVSTGLFLVNHGLYGHILVELGSIVEAPNRLSAKRIALDISPNWATDLRVEEISTDDANKLRCLIDVSRAEADELPA